MTFVPADPRVAAHLAVAIRCHRQRLRADLQPTPPALADIERDCAQRAREGQEGPMLETGGLGDDGNGMTLLLTPEQVADALAVSSSTIKRLLASEDLPSVKIGDARRVHRDDVERYVDSLRGKTRGNVARAS